MFKNILSNYFAPTPKHLLQWSLALRGLIGSLAITTYAVQDNPRVGFWLLVVGAILDFVIHCQKEGGNGNGNLPPYVTRAMMLILPLLCCSLFYGCKPKTAVQVPVQSAIEKINGALIDSLAVKVGRSEQRLARLDTLLQQSANRQTSIINQYKTIYEKIDTTNDSGQLAIMYGLLSAIRQHPLAGDKHSPD